MERIKDWLNELNLDFVKWRYHFGAFSLACVVLSWVAFFVIGPNWGIDFTGGTELQVKFQDEVTIQDVRAALNTLGLSEDSVQQVGADEDRSFQIRIQDATFGADAARADVEKRLTAKFGPDWIEATRFDAEVGARLTVVHKAPAVSVSEVAPLFEDLEGVRVLAEREENTFTVQLPGLARQIQSEIQEAMGAQKFEVQAVEAIGPRVGADLRQQAFIAVFAALFLILIYVAFRFDLAYSPGAVLSLFHDVSVTIGIFVLTQREFSLSLIGALLTLIGYSLNDTIVIYDRIRENQEKYPRKLTSEIINLSVNETLGRTITTNGATLLAISPFLIMGGSIVQDFAFAMLIGGFFGSYSTIYVASPMILVMNDLKPHLARLVAGAALPTAAPEDSEGTPESPLTESEKRRRERAEREKAGQGGHLPETGR
jgi:preprotein translocase subunit SecF